MKQKGKDKLKDWQILVVCVVLWPILRLLGHLTSGSNDKLPALLTIIFLTFANVLLILGLILLVFVPIKYLLKQLKRG